MSVLFQTLKSMHTRKMFKNMLIYVDSCLAGALFKDVLPDDLGIYAMTASDDKTNEIFWYMFEPYPWQAELRGLLFEVKLFECEGFDTDMPSI